MHFVLFIFDDHINMQPYAEIQIAHCVNYACSQRGWCCATGPYNVTTTERYTKSSTVYRRATRSVVHTAVTLPCPSIWYPNRPNEEDCYYYRQEYL